MEKKRKCEHKEIKNTILINEKKKKRTSGNKENTNIKKEKKRISINK